MNISIRNNPTDMLLLLNIILIQSCIQLVNSSNYILRHANSKVVLLEIYIMFQIYNINQMNKLETSIHMFYLLNSRYFLSSFLALVRNYNKLSNKFPQNNRIIHRK